MSGSSGRDRGWRSGLLVVGLLVGCERRPDPDSAWDEAGEPSWEETEATAGQPTARPDPTGAGAPADQARRDLAEMQYRQGLVEARDGFHGRAVERFTAALVHDSTYAAARDARASAYMELDEFALALADAEAAVALEPDHAPYLSNRAQIYRRFDREDEALADLDRAVALDSTFLAARFNRGTLRYQRGEFTAALTDFESCIALAPGDAPPYFNRAVTLEALGRVEEARADLVRFLERSQDTGWNEIASRLLAEWEGR